MEIRKEKERNGTESLGMMGREEDIRKAGKEEELR